MKKTAMQGGRRRSVKLADYAGLLGICFAAALVFALLRKTDSFILALGDAFLVEALICLGLSWVGYLKRDGIRIFPSKKRGADVQPESWKDRIPQLGQEPPSPSPLPGPGGPESPDYRRLVEAENRLRQRILGVDENPGVSDSDVQERNGAKKNSLSLLLAGVFLFLLGLLFEYVLPALLMRL